MKTLIIIFGLLYGVNCKPAEIDFNDYLHDWQFNGEYYTDGDYSGDYSSYTDASQEQVVTAVTKEETFVKNLGESVLLPCVFTGFNYVRLWVKKDDSERYVLFQSTVRMSASDNFEELPNGTLKITNLTAKDDGQYVCTALAYTDQEKNPKITHTLKIIVPPQIKSLTAKDNRTVLISGDTLSLSCQAIGFPTPVISWYKGDEKLSIEGENFAIPNVKHHNAGQYACMAENKIGEPDFKSITIQVESEKSSGCSFSTSTVLIPINVASVIIFLVRSPMLRI